MRRATSRTDERRPERCHRRPVSSGRPASRAAVRGSSSINTHNGSADRVPVGRPTTARADPAVMAPAVAVAIGLMTARF